MSASADRSLRMRLWAVLSVAFVTLGAVAILTLARLAVTRYESDYRDNLLTVSKLVANSLDADGLRHLGFVSPNSAGFSTAEELNKARGTVPGLLNAQVYMPRDDRWVAVAAPSNPEFAPGEDAQSIREAFATGQTVLRENETGRAISSYVPIVASDGQTAAVLVLRKDASDLLARTAAVRSGAYWTVALVAFLGILFSFIITAYLLAANGFETLRRPWSGSAKLFRGTIMELLFIGMIAIVVASAGVGLVLQKDAEAEVSKSLNRVRHIELFRGQVVNAVAAGGASETGTSQLAAMARGAELPWQPTASSLTTSQLLSLSKMAEAELTRETASYRSLEGAIDLKNKGLLAVFGISLFLSLGAIVLLRTTRRQEGELLEARESMARQEAAYKQIADNLPIGFYTYAASQIGTSNAAWDRLVNRKDDETQWDSFVRALHPEDRERVVSTLARTETEHGAFGLAFRLVGSDGSTRHVETRGVSVQNQEGGTDHIVGFLVDISSRVRAQRLLEDKNKEVQASNDMLRKALEEIESNFEAMVHSLVKAVEAKDPYTAGHSERVMAYSIKIGERMGLSAEELRVLKMGTLVHDIGKIGIPDAILTKPMKLTDEEYEMIKQHPVLGYRMIERIPTFAECLPIVLHHHERLDGRGYPHGLKGLEIPLLVRISTVADCFDAMTSDRAYRKGMDPLVAIEQLYSDADRKLVDRHIVGVLQEIVEEEGIIREVPRASVA